MQDIATQIIGIDLEPEEFNSILNELKNLITNTGITLSEFDLNQLGKTVANIVGSVNFYIDTGVADAYVLNVTGNFQSPTVYTIGMLVRFRPTNDNTGASTINVSSLGIKNIKKEDGTTDLNIGDISTIHDTFLRYDGTSFISVGNTFNNLIMNNLTVNTLLQTIFAGTPVADTIQWINVVNNVQDLAATGYGVGRRFNLSDANPLLSAGVAGFAETNNATSVGLAMFLFNSVNFLKVAQLRSPTNAASNETYFEAENFGNFILNTPITTGGGTVDFTTFSVESGIFCVMGIGGGNSRFRVELFIYGGDAFGAALDFVGQVSDSAMFTVAFLSTTSGVHTFRITGGGVGNSASDALYVVKMPFRNIVNL